MPVRLVDRVRTEELEHVVDTREDGGAHVAADAEVAGPRCQRVGVLERLGVSEPDHAEDPVVVADQHLVLGGVILETGLDRVCVDHAVRLPRYSKRMGLISS